MLLLSRLIFIKVCRRVKLQFWQGCFPLKKSYDFSFSLWSVIKMSWYALEFFLFAHSSSTNLAPFHAALSVCYLRTNFSFTDINKRIIPSKTRAAGKQTRFLIASLMKYIIAVPFFFNSLLSFSRKAHSAETRKVPLAADLLISILKEWSLCSHCYYDQ